MLLLSSAWEGLAWGAMSSSSSASSSFISSWLTVSNTSLYLLQQKSCGLQRPSGAVGLAWGTWVDWGPPHPPDPSAHIPLPFLSAAAMGWLLSLLPGRNLCYRHAHMARVDSRFPGAVPSDPPLLRLALQERCKRCTLQSLRSRWSPQRTKETQHQCH